MGLFNFDFSTIPDGDRPRRKGVFLYLELFLGKFFKLILSNMLYFLLSLPLLLVLYFYFPADYIISIVSKGSAFTPEQLDFYAHIIRMAGTLMLITLFGSGPASAGLAYILRSFTRGEAVWLWSDFFEKSKENFKQSIVVLIVDILLVPLIYIAFATYFTFYTNTQNSLYLVLLYLIFILVLMLILMHTFLYQLMITYKCTIPMLYKNAFLLSVARFPICFILVCLSLFIIWSLSSFFHPIFMAFLFFVIGYQITRFPLEFYAARTIEKLIKASSKGENE